MSYALLYLLTGGVLLAAEAAWLGLVAGELFRAEVGHLMGPDFVLPPAVAFYAIFLVGILVFAVLPGLESGSVMRAAALGGLLGFVAYSTFDLTSMSVFRDFPLRVAVIDIAWGTFVTASTASASFMIGRVLGMGG